MRAMWLAGLVAIAVLAAFGSWFLISGRQSNQGETATAAPLANPFGEPRNRADTGEQHYIHGRYPEAVAWWAKAAAGGDLYAAHRLGVEYQDGKPWVVQRDYARALQYHLQAARGGYALSMFDLGTMHEMGFGVEKSLEGAAKWYGHSARYGLAQGQYNFATMLERGDGIARDDIEALKFFILAARNGFTGIPYDDRTYRIDQKAPTPAQRMEARLAGASVNEARARADAFVPLEGPLAGE